jgi:hypothetical protein
MPETEKWRVFSMPELVESNTNMLARKACTLYAISMQNCYVNVHENKLRRTGGLRAQVYPGRASSAKLCFSSEIDGQIIGTFTSQTSFLKSSGVPDKIDILR